MTKEKTVAELKSKMALLPEFGRKDFGDGVIIWKNPWESLCITTGGNYLLLGEKQVSYEDIASVNITNGKLQLVVTLTLE
jgi:hypothetical protein